MIELVLSGPEVLAAPAADTRATMDALIASATSEMFLVGYAVHNGADGKSALITSANFTEAAQRRNIEAGVLVSHRPLVGRLRSFFAAGIQTGWLRQCQLGT